MKLRCWWFGCDSDGEWRDWPHCTRCGDPVDYADLVGDTRHRRFMDRCRYWLFRKWIPARCPECGKRYRCDPSCDGLPF